MSRAVLGALIVFGLVVAVAGAQNWPAPAATQRPASTVQQAGESSLIVVPSSSADNGQLLTVVDPRSRALAVYRIDPTGGKIKLLSVRNIQFDLQVMDLNSEKPSPQEIRSLLEQR